jgi:hypothetical protein
VHSLISYLVYLVNMNVIGLVMGTWLIEPPTDQVSYVCSLLPRSFREYLHTVTNKHTDLPAVLADTLRLLLAVSTMDPGEHAKGTMGAERDAYSR